MKRDTERKRALQEEKSSRTVKERDAKREKEREILYVGATVRVCFDFLISVDTRETKTREKERRSRERVKCMEEEESRASDRWKEREKRLS